MKDPLLLNKIAAGILLPALVITAIGFLGHFIRPHHDDSLRAYTIADVAAVVTETGQETAPEPVSPLLASADPTRGQKLAKKCTACHTFEAGGVNKVGPNLYDIVNKTPAAVQGFAYSQDMQDMATAWDYETLALFIYKPKALLKGTKMNFVGLKKVQDRADLIAYLRTLSSNPAPLP